MGNLYTELYLARVLGRVGWGGMRWDGEKRCVPPSPAPFMRKS